MAAEIADEIEVELESGIVEYAPGIAADGEHPSGLDSMRFVQRELVGVLT